MTTDDEGDGADFGDPLETTVIIPASLNQASGNITEMPLEATQEQTGYLMAGWQSVIHTYSAEPVDPADPYIAQFTIQLPLEVLPPQGTTADAQAGSSPRLWGT